MKRVLFLLKVPPPVHGSTLMNQKVMQSHKIQQSFDCYYLPLSISSDVDDIGKFSFRKILKVFGSYFSLLSLLRKSKADLVYFALSPYGTAFIKDFFFTFSSMSPVKKLSFTCTAGE
jgi:hypothetical protein